VICQFIAKIRLCQTLPRYLAHSGPPTFGRCLIVAPGG
jgi:hypothetical protein